MTLRLPEKFGQTNNQTRTWNEMTIVGVDQPKCVIG